MASENETVDDIVKEKRDTADEAELKGKNTFSFDLAKMLREEANRIEAAHRREVAELKSKMNDVVCENEALREACGTCCAKLEVAELRECLKEAVTEVCNRLEKCGFKEPCVFKTCYVQKWRKALKGASND